LRFYQPLLESVAQLFTIRSKPGDKLQLTGAFRTMFQMLGDLLDLVEVQFTTSEFD